MIKKFGKILLILVALLLSLQYILNPKYHFPSSNPFSGNYYYNPYQNIDSAQWRKANFHVHTRQWLGLSNGRNNTNESVDSFYRYFGYEMYNISDYQTINDFEKDQSWYIPVYEHAYMPTKNHQIVLNAHHITWLDYLFPQTLDNKQQVIDELKRDTESVVAIAHPHWQDRYSPSDFKYLCHYDLMEVLNQNRFSIAYWDSALSSGHPAFILSDDDAHDLSDLSEGAHCLTFINATLEKDSILKSLKAGRAYGADVDGEHNNSFAERRMIFQQLSYPNKITMNGDTLAIAMNKKEKSFRFVGQGGKLMAIVKDNQQSAYVFTPSDTYIRIEVKEEGGTTYYLNPVFRYDGKSVPQYTATVDVFRTWLWRIAFLIIAVILGLKYYPTKKYRDH